MNNLLLVEHCGGWAGLGWRFWMAIYMWATTHHLPFGHWAIQKRQCAAAHNIYCAVQCATAPNSKQPKRKLFDFGYFMLMLLCFLIHLVWNSWHIFRCTLQIIVVHRLGSVIVFHVFLSSVSLLSRSQRQLASLFVCMPMVFCGVFMAVKSHTIAHMSNVSEAYFRSYFLRFRCFSFYTFSQIFRN